MAVASPQSETRASGQTWAYSLDYWAAHHWRDGVQVPGLAALERLLVRTRNNVYELIVVDPVRAEVLVRGGRYFPEFTRAHVDGSSMGGGFLKLHGIYAGLCLELRTADQAIVTSPVHAIARATDGPAS